MDFYNTCTELQTCWTIFSAYIIPSSHLPWRGFLFVGDIMLKSNYSSFICWDEHYTYMQTCANRAEESVLTRTTGQMYKGNRVWSLNAPPSHSGFTLDAHLLWSYGGEEKHKNCGCNPSVGVSMSNVRSMKHFGGSRLSWQAIQHQSKSYPCVYLYFRAEYFSCWNYKHCSVDSMVNSEQTPGQWWHLVDLKSNAI